MAQFINSQENIDAEAVDDTVAASGEKLAHLDVYPHIRVVDALARLFQQLVNQPLSAYRGTESSAICTSSV